MQSDSKLSSKLYLEQYTPEFVGRWDELINWERRRRAENGFFERVLTKAGARHVLDIACGTGYHTIMLSRSGFEVTGADGSAPMIAKSKENAALRGMENLRFVECEWSELSRFFPCGHQFDAILCLGNAFTHLFDEQEQRQALAEIRALLNPSGIAIIDHRNYDAMLDRGFSNKHVYYYLGTTVEVRPLAIRRQAVELEYRYTDGETHCLTLFPLRQEYLTGLLKEVGFESVVRFGDFEKEYEFFEPDFIIQVARKS